MCKDCFDTQYYSFPSQAEFEKFEELLDLKCRSEKSEYWNRRKKSKMAQWISECTINAILAKKNMQCQFQIMLGEAIS